MSESDLSWWERQGNFVGYPELGQGQLPHCVYASISGAINHLVNRDVWTPLDLLNECRRRGHVAANFGAVDPALDRISDEVEKHHHNKDWSSEPLSVSLIRKWIDEGSVVILSRELRIDPLKEQRGWHMFSLVARDNDRFQVWDTNGFRGFLTEDEVTSGFDYPNGEFFLPHDKEDTLVLKSKIR